MRRRERRQDCRRHGRDQENGGRDAADAIGDAALKSRAPGNLHQAKYTALRDAFLDGELSVAEATGRIGELTLSTEQQREWAGLLQLEQGLTQLGQAAEVPWTRLRVETALAGREQARQWLTQHPRGLLGLSGLSLAAQDWRRGAFQVAAAVGGGTVGWGIGALLTSLGPGLPSVIGLSLPLLAAGGCALLALAALRWPELRGYFTA